MKSTLMAVYFVTGCLICGWFTMAAAYQWRAPDFGVVKALRESNRGGGGGGYYGGGRSYGGSWGGGK
ncbi:hypothetical protein FYK55_03425 [Roseiconus nitratireducens]|uniref:Uncharacterized protein n=1 Tax=Roseiconus nitratireducens TaxID=2605748 RepID=A0A5M6DEN2_9BACT|nr:hypothetical protein [Roseiconus nitratireducens]KAA5545977.1 hypothetical protein FYK55_03425 [Roseiconus nitratireducens]